MKYIIRFIVERILSLFSCFEYRAYIYNSPSFKIHWNISMFLECFLHL